MFSNRMIIGIVCITICVIFVIIMLVVIIKYKKQQKTIKVAQSKTLQLIAENQPRLQEESDRLTKALDERSQYLKKDILMFVGLPVAGTRLPQHKNIPYAKALEMEMYVIRSVLLLMYNSNRVPSNITIIVSDASREFLYPKSIFYRFMSYEDAAKENPDNYRYYVDAIQLSTQTTFDLHAVLNMSYFAKISLFKWFKKPKFLENMVKFDLLPGKHIGSQYILVNSQEMDESTLLDLSTSLPEDVILLNFEQSMHELMCLASSPECMLFISKWNTGGKISLVLPIKATIILSDDVQVSNHMEKSFLEACHSHQFVQNKIDFISDLRTVFDINHTTKNIFSKL
jgi:hypothetical protein